MKKPDYDAAFVFVDDGMNNYDVPPLGDQTGIAEGRDIKSLPLEGKMPQCAHWGG